MVFWFKLGCEVQKSVELISNISLVDKVNDSLSQNKVIEEDFNYGIDLSNAYIEEETNSEIDIYLMNISSQMPCQMK